MNQKNTNDIPKCSARQTLTNGAICTYNKNTFMWCNIKSTKVPNRGIIVFLQNIMYKNL